MPKVATYSCAGCGAVKQKANHWWTVFTNNYRVSVMPFDAENDQPGNEYYCGRSCAMKAVSEWMDKQK